MTALLETILVAVGVLLLFPVAILLVEVVSSLAHRDESAPPLSERQSSIAIVMPAHNEALMIGGTLRSLVPQLGGSDRLVVVADNCTDETAALAVAEGAEVIVRTDLERRGKGYALDFGVRHLEADPPEIVMIIDSDCWVAPGAVERLARRCAQSGRPVQALYLMKAGEAAGLKQRVAEFAWAVINQVRPTGLHRLGLPCQLMGAGMAFPWSGISSSALATGHIVEDRILGMDLARAGTPPLFCPEAVVTSRFPSSKEGIRGQRSRWEHGSLGVLLRQAPRLLWDSLAPLNIPLMALALDLFVPPLALLALGLATIWIAAILFYLAADVRLPLELASSAVVLFALSVVLSWSRYGRQMISLGSLALAMIYALWKIPLYVKFVMARQLHWVRSKRD